MHLQTKSWSSFIEESTPIYQNEKNKTSVHMITKNDKKYAVKVIPYQYLGNRSTEIQFCRNLKVKPLNHIVKILEVEDNPTRKYWLVVMEKYQNLTNFIKDQSQLLKSNPVMAIDIVLQICYGLVNLNRMHRDLKPSNILIRLIDNKVDVVLSDFGDCNNGQKFNNSSVGTQFYSAPQVKIHDINYYDSKVDVWSLALIIFQLFGIYHNKSQINHKFPQFPDQINTYLPLSNSPQKLQQVSQFLQKNPPIINQRIPFCMRQLMRKLIKPKRQERLYLYSILDHFYANRQEINKLNQNCKPYQLKSISKIAYYRQVQKQKDQSSFCYEQIMKILINGYKKWYINLSLSGKIKIEQIRYYRFALYLYAGIGRIIQIYHRLLANKIIKPELLNCLVFGEDKKNISDLEAEHLFLQNKIIAFGQQVEPEDFNNLGDHTRIKEYLRESTLCPQIYKQIQKNYSQLFQQMRLN